MSANSPKKIRLRINIIIFIFAFTFLAVIGKAFQYQFLEHEKLAGEAKSNSEKKFKWGSIRGEFFDTNGESLAVSLKVDSVFVDGKKLNDRQDTALKLAETLNLKEDLLSLKLEKAKGFVWIKRQITAEESEKIKELNLPGVSLTKESQRFYPNDSLGAHVLGFVGIDGNGLEGLELGLNKYLTVKEEPIVVRRDALGRIVLDSVEVPKEESKGASVILTLDRRLQYLAEKHIQNAVTEVNAKSGQVLIIRPKTGEILAAAIWPPFDPNNYLSSPSANRRNRVIADVYEPGSTFKVFIVAAALEEKLVTPDDLIYCEKGAYKVSNYYIKDTRRYENLSVNEVIQKSSNIGAVKIGEKLGQNLMYNYLNRFNFGDKTGIEYLNGESQGLLKVPYPKAWHELEAANMTFGQGLSVTSLQMVMAMGALANDGLLMKPYLVKEIISADGKTILKSEPQILRQVVSATTARQVGSMLRGAVLTGGTGRRADCPGYPVAGKTGTAQKVGAGRKTYGVGKYVASFLGYVPYNNPELAIMVMIDEPRGRYYGGDIAAPVFKNIASEALPILDVPASPDDAKPLWTIAKKDSPAPFQQESLNTVRVKVNIREAMRGDIPSTLTEDKIFAENNQLPLLEIAQMVESVPGIMPDLTGLSMGRVLDLLSIQGVEFKAEGSGHVVAQDPPAGSPLLPGQICQVVFAGS